MSATREIIAALVATGMDAAYASTLLARAAVEMTSVVIRKSPGAKRQERWRGRERERLKASQSVSRNATPEADQAASQSVSKRLKASPRDAPENPPLTCLLPPDDNLPTGRKESKKERSPKKRDGPLPEDWKPPERSFALAAEHGTTVPYVEAIFRDYLASKGKRYADYDAAFCNFVRNQSNFNGGKSGVQADQRSLPLFRAVSGGGGFSSIGARLRASGDPSS